MFPDERAKMKRGKRDEPLPTGRGHRDTRSEALEQISSTPVTVIKLLFRVLVFFKSMLSL